MFSIKNQGIFKIKNLCSFYKTVKPYFLLVIKFLFLGIKHMIRKSSLKLILVSLAFFFSLNSKGLDSIGDLADAAIGLENEFEDATDALDEIARLPSVLEGLQSFGENVTSQESVRLLTATALDEAMPELYKAGAVISAELGTAAVVATAFGYTIKWLFSKCSKRKRRAEVHPKECDLEAARLREKGVIQVIV